MRPKPIIAGIPELNAKLANLKENFNAGPINRLCQNSLKPIASQAKANARRGPTGAVVRGIKIFAGKKAARFGAAAILKVAWKYSGAILEEWGRREITPEDARRPDMKAFRIPMSKWGSSLRRGGARQGIVAGVKTKMRGGAVVRLSGSFGFGFFRRLKGMTGTHFFERAVDQRMPDAQRIFEEGAKQIVDDSVR